jgi:hypothetical protein
MPDGYLLDFSSPKKPVLYIVEVELSKHDPLRHIAQQLLGFSLSFKSTPQKMKGILRDTVQKSSEVVAPCEHYAASNGFNNIDYLLEQMIYPDDAFNALVIIDELEEELESILHSSLRFPEEKSPGGWGQDISPTIMKRCQWVKPLLVAQIKFTEWTLDSQLRQPVFLGLRTDKDAKDVVRE